LLGAAVHSFAETLPLGVGIRRRSAGHGRGGNSGELIVTRLVALGINLSIHGINLSEEPIGVIGQVIRISQDLLHGGTTSSDFFQNTVLLDQSILKHRGVLIQNARSFNAEVINDGGGFRA
jgi:hypothetical protein